MMPPGSGGLHRAGTAIRTAPGRQELPGYRFSGDGMTRLSSQAFTTSSALGGSSAPAATAGAPAPSVTESEAAAATAPRRTRTANGSAMARLSCT